MSAKPKPASKDAGHVDALIQEAYLLGRQHQQEEDTASKDDAWYEGYQQAMAKKAGSNRASFIAGLGLRSAFYLTLGTLVFIVLASLAGVLSGNCS